MYNRPVERWCGQVITHATQIADIIRTYGYLNNIIVYFEPFIELFAGHTQGSRLDIRMGDLPNLALEIKAIREKCLDGTLYDYLDSIWKEASMINKR